MITTSDIKSMGWELDQCVDGDCFYYIGNMIDYNEFVLIKSKHHDSIEIFNISPNIETTDFEGVINNIEELKDIMKRYGIER